MMKNKKYYIYIFQDSKRNVLYIGKTNRNIYKRIKEHIKTKSWILSVSHILITELTSPVDQDLAEIYYINKYHPKYNEANNYKDEVYNPDFIKIKNLYFHELSIVECLMIGSYKSKSTYKNKKKEIIFLNYFNVFNPIVYEEYKNSIFQYKDLTIKIQFSEKEMSLLDYLEAINCLKNIFNSKDASPKKITEEIYEKILCNLTKEKLKIIVNNTTYEFIDKFIFFNNTDIPKKIFFNKEFEELKEKYNLYII